MIGFGFLPGVNTLSLIGIVGIVGTVAQVAHAHEHSRDFYKSRSRPRPRHADTTTKPRPRNFTLVDRYEGKTFFECVHGAGGRPILLLRFYLLRLIYHDLSISLTATGSSSLLTIRPMA